MSDKFAVRYWMQTGEFDGPKEGEFVEIAPGFPVSTTDLGYAKRAILVISLGNESFLIASSDGNPPPKGALLEAKDAIEHYLREGHFHEKDGGENE